MLRFVSILILSAGCGYVSLSQEILWVRTMGWATEDSPNAFAYVLGFFLIGIAGGAYLGKNISETHAEKGWAFIATGFFLNGAFFSASLPAMAAAHAVHSVLGNLTAYAFILITCFFSGWVFPLLCHMGIPEDDRVSGRLSWIYAANIIGATLGPIMTGFVLLDVLPLHDCFLVMGSSAVMLCCFTIAVAPGIRRRSASAFAVVACGFLLFLAVNPLHTGVLHRLLFHDLSEDKPPFKYMVQNRSGIIVVEPGVHDAVYGGGVYDGRFNIDPIIQNDNWVDRAYLAACVHGGVPYEALVIGLGSGSWARVVANNPSLKKVTVVEINPGYKEIIRHYPENATLFKNKKVKIVCDDGRRWLQRNPDVRFDLIIMNTSVNWRSQATNLLSREFFELCNLHMKTGAVMFCNVTGSRKVAYTATHVFRYVYVYLNSIVSSNVLLDVSPEKRLQCLQSYQNSEGGVMFDITDPKILKGLENLARIPIHDISALRMSPDIELVTDDSMATEFPGWTKKGRGYSQFFAKLFQDPKKLPDIRSLP